MRRREGKEVNGLIYLVKSILDRSFLALGGSKL